MRGCRTQGLSVRETSELFFRNTKVSDAECERAGIQATQLDDFLLKSFNPIKLFQGMPIRQPSSREYATDHKSSMRLNIE